MIGNALHVLGQPSDPSLGTPFSLDANGLNGALSQLNGGAELLVPTSQASVVQTTQTSRQTAAIEERLKELRDWTTGTALAGTEPPRLAQVASSNIREPDDGLRLAQNQPLEFAYSTGPFGVFVSGLGQFGSRDQTTTETGYSFNNAGFIAGADYRFTSQLIAGLAFGCTQSNTQFRHQRTERVRSILERQVIAGEPLCHLFRDRCVVCERYWLYRRRQQQFPTPYRITQRF
jgi:hypothetical protein